MDLRDVRSRISAHLIGRDAELELALAAVAAGRDLVLEGPPGTSKTTLLKAIAGEWGIPVFFVEGNADLTPSRLIGHHDPARVLREDYRPENFVQGPLVQAMREGGFLYVEEFNRAPDDTLNVLLTAMADRQTTIPRLGVVAASPTFRVVASMNPYDNVGTTRLSASIKDRMCRIRVDYQDAGDETTIVLLRATHAADRVEPLLARLAADAVAVTRATRAHPSVRQGSSVRGAIDCVAVAQRLASLRGIVRDDDPLYPRLMLDAMTVALSGRLHVEDAVDATAEAILEQIWTAHFGDGETISLSEADPDARLPNRLAPRSAPRPLAPLARKPKSLDGDPILHLFTAEGNSGHAAPGAERTRGRARRGPNGAGSDASDDASELAEAGAHEEVDVEALAVMREIAAALAVSRPSGRPLHRRHGKPASVPYRGGSDEIDVDRTLEVLVEQPALAAGDIVVREPLRARRSVVLLIDVSGSMRGERVRTAAAAIAALAGELVDDDLAVYSFWSDAAKLRGIGEPVAPFVLLERLLAIPAKGLTNVAFPLQLAAQELAGASPPDSRAVLLSDCVHNAGPDPRAFAAKLPRLDVLVDVSDTHDLELGRDLAFTGRGILRATRTYRDVACGLRAMFAA